MSSWVYRSSEAKASEVLEKIEEVFFVANNSRLLPRQLPGLKIQLFANYFEEHVSTLRWYYSIKLSWQSIISKRD